MKNFFLLSTLLFLVYVPAVSVFSQTDGKIAALARLCGAEDEESLDQEETDRLSFLLAHPLEINRLSRNRLLSCGLFTPFQVASLTDYRKTFGDILSISELAAVDGFGSEFSQSLAPFLRLTSPRLPGQPEADSPEIRHELSGRISFKSEDLAWGCKVRSEYHDRIIVSGTARSTYSDLSSFPPSSWTGNVTLMGRRIPGKVILGDFSARFGQGLVLWSGMSMSGFSSASSFCRRATGLSPSWSYSNTGGHRGLAMDSQFGRFVVSAFASFPGLKSWCESGTSPEISFLPAANVTWYGRSGQLSATAFWLSEPAGSVPDALFYQAGGKVSVDGRWSWRGVDFWGEAAYDCHSETPAGVTGVSVPILDEWKVLAVVRSYPSGFSSSASSGVRCWTNTSDERGVALGVERRTTCITLDLASKFSDNSSSQLKFLAKTPFQLSPRLVLTVKATERFRPYEKSHPHRAGLRLDTDWSSSGLDAVYGESGEPSWRARIRLEGLYCKASSFLSYFEAGRTSERFSTYFRSTVFFIDNWDDRIYSYERDAPGNFNVPAYYGRGISLSAVLSAKFRIAPAPRRKGITIHAYSRASLLTYPFMSVSKPSSSEFKCQLSVEF